MKRVVDFKAGEKIIQRIDLRSICTSHNPRNPAVGLRNGMDKEGYKVLSFIDLAQFGLSQDEKKRKEFCRFIETYETDHDGILFLATSRIGAEVQPILLRDYRALANPQPEGAEKPVYNRFFGIIAGERRYLAAVYNYAKNGTEPTIGAVVHKMTVEEAGKLAFMENIFRRNPTPLEVGEFLHEQRQKINPNTNENYKLGELAREFGLEYYTAAGREALAYLSEADKKKLLSNKLGLTNAIKKGSAIRRGEDPDAIDAPEKKNTRKRVLSLSAVRKMFDDGECVEPPDRVGYRKALAAVMGLSYEEALAESQNRQDAEELREAEEIERKVRDS
jgi:ParB-like chromosome segregation protein Spo0J